MTATTSHPHDTHDAREVEPGGQAVRPTPPRGGQADRPHRHGDPGQHGQPGQHGEPDAFLRLAAPEPGTHFADPYAVEVRFPRPLACPTVERVALAGVAMTPDGRVSLVLDALPARAHFGPDTPTVTRRATLLAAALVASGVPRIDATTAAAWVLTLWAALADETAAALIDLDPDHHPDDATTAAHALGRTLRAVTAALQAPTPT